MLIPSLNTSVAMSLMLVYDNDGIKTEEMIDDITEIKT
jgi:hypothetical protein